MATHLLDDRARLFSLHNVAWGLLLATCLGLVTLVSVLTYNVFFHPLRKYPGPKWWAATRLPYTRAYLSGQMHKKIFELHQEYGPIVRVAPNELAYNHPDAWKDLHGNLKNGTGDHGRDEVFMRDNRQSIIGGNREDHSRYRRALSHGFSAQSMFDQESIIKKYVDLLFQRLHENCAGGSKPLDMVAWYNWTTFDVIGDLAFGEPFGCLDNSDYHPWVKILFAGVKEGAFKFNIRRYPLIENLLMKFIPASIRNKREQHIQLTREKVMKRLATQTERPDFMDSMTRKKGPMELQFEELRANSSTLIVAGSETTATALSAITYYLTTHTSALEKLNNEVRSAFATENDINMVSVQKLQYMQAIINESLRMYPPVPTGIMRRVSEGDGLFLGQHVPKGSLVQVWHWPVFHNPDHFTLPDSFIPERWLDDPRFSGDRKEAFQPFSVGPRNCIGRNLAYAEMRLIVARMVWNFDMRIAEDSKGWDDRSQAFLLWEKGPVNCYITPRKVE
ncbi:Isotrichodermin C-15 hydroxylase [Colletotrichum gloeosporioides]|uniref:Isotrichodermin C-15 hydroxylase n=1 Tax=Colletotrichum gloeosporioides TaxID=474922 RepID=A0A8H4FIZ0_COLGL|nr:Isotrichodermin C-15 hydroxylase [Colletotrichum gloeosporioides]KAF3803795.1 Isotrichodermin C-15 hydroxylase [Colletotrichum gloeosporioides]